MARRSLDQLKAAFGEQPSNNENSGFWDKFFPFFKMEMDQTSIVRFLPDQDEENPMGFLVENLYHKLTVNGRTKQVACLKMYGESCPCCELSRKYYAEKNEDLGLKYWHKKEYIGQVLVLDTPLPHDVKEGENPVRLISLGPKIFKLIRDAFQSGDLEESPCDLKAGYDFRLKKTPQGQYADYTMSKFVPKQSAVPEHLLGSIELYDLKNWRYKKVEREQMEAMIEADRTGGELSDTETEATPASKVQAAISSPKEAVVATTKAEAEAPAAAAASSTTNDILARIRARQKS